MRSWIFYVDEAYRDDIKRNHPVDAKKHKKCKIGLTELSFNTIHLHKKLFEGSLKMSTKYFVTKSKENEKHPISLKHILESFPFKHLYKKIHLVY